MSKALAMILVCAPTILSIIDHIGATLPFDPLTLSVLLGAIGIILFGVAEWPNKRRMLVVAGLSVVAVVVQIYAIAMLVQQESNLSYSEIII